MPLSISPIEGLGGAPYLAAPAAPAATDGAGFGAAMTGAIDNLQQLQGASQELSMKAITGDLTDIHSATLASTRAAVTLELIAAVRNKGVDAFNEIMRMQA